MISGVGHTLPPDIITGAGGKPEPEEPPDVTSSASEHLNTSDLKPYKEPPLTIGGFFEGFGKFLLGIFNYVKDVVGEAIRTITDTVGAFVNTLLQGRSVLTALVAAGITFAHGAYTTAGVATFLEPVSRGLNEEEQEIAKDVFGDSLDLSQVRVREGFSLSNLLATEGGGAYEFRGTITMQSTANHLTFVHELVHAWQEEHGNTLVSKLLQTSARGKRHGEYDWRKAMSEGKSWMELTVEQQAHLIENWWWEQGWIKSGGMPSPQWGPQEKAFARDAMRKLQRGHGAAR